MMGECSSRLYLPSATYLNLVNADFFFFAGFFCRAVSVEDALYLAVNGNADINTTYSMGTAVMTLLAALLRT